MAVEQLLMTIRELKTKLESKETQIRNMENPLAQNSPESDNN